MTRTLNDGETKVAATLFDLRDALALADATAKVKEAAATKAKAEADTARTAADQAKADLENYFKENVTG